MLMFLAVSSALPLATGLIRPGYSEASASPSKDWGVFFDTRGAIKVNITEPGVAVRLEVPREFMPWRAENDTSFIKSDISDDYYYYKVVDQSEHYPYDGNAPYTVEVWHPPVYGPGCVRTWINFTPPRYILLEDLEAPAIAGIYNLTVYIAPNMGDDGTPNFPSKPNKILKIPVSMREDSGWISGYIVDETAHEYIRAKGVVFAVHKSGAMARAYVNSTTGFFNLTGLYEGDYTLTASAGYFPLTGYAYAPTTLGPVHVNRGSGTLIGNFSLNRGCIIKGSITYLDENGLPIKPLDTPYLKALNYKDLNYTVEVYDEDGRIVASRTYPSRNQPIEEFTLTVRNGTRYVGDSALGTEYSGFGPGIYKVKAWVYGFTRPADATVTVTGYGQTGTVSINLRYGAVVSGRIILTSGVTGAPETPREAEMSAFKTESGRSFGGHILIELYNREGVLKGLTVINGTYANGTTRYADQSTVRFWILGFSELHNHSYSGTWVEGSYPGPSPWDYGLEAGTYYIRVWIRGYLQKEIPTVTLSEMGNSTVTVWMKRGGALDVTVYSYHSKPGTRLIQAPTPWRFLELCPPPHLRIYVYGEGGAEIGYAEKILRLGEPGVTETSARLNFTGHNWPLEMIYLGYLPTAIDQGNYRIEGYTYGYVQAREVSVYIPISQMVSLAFPLLIGCGIHGSVPLMADALFVSLTENATARVEALLEGSLMGVNVTRAAVGDSSLSFHIYGFYGRGHFFYVDPEGYRWRDYGLDTGNYSVHVPEFGYDRHFMQEVEVYADLPWLMMERGVYFPVQRMIKIYGTVTGFDYLGHVHVLSWVNIYSAGRETYSMDGYYAIHLPRDTSFEVAYSMPGYREHATTLSTNDQIGYSPTLEESGEPFP
ncbi:MAG: hypothetical protein QW176_08660 [Candidatus Bathyarchaeia archaeon]